LTGLGFGAGTGFGGGSSGLGAGWATIFGGVIGSLGKGARVGTAVGASVITADGVRSSGSSSTTGSGNGVTIISSVLSRPVVGDSKRSQPHVSDNSISAPTWIATDEMKAGPSDQGFTVGPFARP
jgi:hypothetical protein